jgi:hypothetical protein
MIVWDWIVVVVLCALSLGLVLATNAAFVEDWLRLGLGLGLAAIFALWLMRRVLA